MINTCSVPGASLRHFWSMQVRQAFLSRRKMLRNSLQISQSSEQIGSALSAAGVSPDARAQDLTTQDFARFAKHLGADIYTVI